MSELHSVGASIIGPETIESVGAGFVREGLARARRRSWEALAAIRGMLREGMTEDEARRLALDMFRDLGVTKHWHKPYIRFGKGTALTFNQPLQPDYRLREGDPFYIDLGPVWPDAELGLEYEGDVGDTFVLGSNPEARKCAELSRMLFAEAQDRWKAEGLSGEAIYAHLRRRAQEIGYVLVEGVHGHRLGDFPHHRHSKEVLARVPFRPAESLWVLEVQLNHPTLELGAFYEDVLDSQANPPRASSE